MSLQSLFYQVTGPDRRFYHQPMYWCLCWVSWIYEALQGMRAWAYAARFFKSERLPVPVISVGNLTLGGTGKTPTVMWVAETLKQHGLRPAILTRGYGGEIPEDVNIVTDGTRVLLSAEEAGDEPVMMARRLSGIPILAGAKRVRLARHAIREMQANVLILDDGFQHLALERDLNLLLLDFKRPVGNGRVFPSGELREGWNAARRADAVILTRSIPGETAPNLEFPPACDGPLIKTSLQPDYIVEVGQLVPRSLDSIRGKKLAAFCGIVQPEDFFNLLENAGATLVMKQGFPDHFDYPERIRSQLIEAAREAGAEALITTEKDAVKWSATDALPLWVVGLKMEVLEGRDVLTDLLLKTAQANPIEVK